MLVYFIVLHGILPSASQSHDPCITPVILPTDIEEPTFTACREGDFDYVIGSGSDPIVSTSQEFDALYGIPLPGVKFFIKGSFTINSTWELTGAIVQVRVGSSISIVQGGLMLSGTHVSSCTGLWRGFNLSSDTWITTSNNTKIEDAEIAINASLPRTRVEIGKTTFDRNLICLLLLGSGNIVNDPILISHGENKFTCTSSLKVGGITQYGILANIPVHLGGINNHFETINAGVVLNGKTASFRANKTTFKNIYNVAVYAEWAKVELIQCTFVNNPVFSLQFANLIHADIGGCKFLHNTAANTSNAFYRALYIEKLLPNSKLTVSDGNNFEVSAPNMAKFIEIKPNGGTTIPGVTINIAENSFKFNNSALGRGIDISAQKLTNVGYFDIYKNTFTVNKFAGAGASTVYPIYISDSEISKLRIFENTFDGENTSTSARSGTVGVYIKNVIGEGNLIAHNDFPIAQQTITNPLGFGYQFNYVDGIVLSSSNRFLVCSNFARNCNKLASFLGSQGMVTFTNNTSAPGSLVGIYGNDSWIGTQEQHGNQIYPIFIVHPTITWRIIGSPQAECYTNEPALSRFLVHQQQSTNYGAYSGDPVWHPYHPKDIEPDAMDEWWRQENGVPAGPCDNPADGFRPNVAADDSLYAEAAAGNLVNRGISPATVYLTEIDLYEYLRMNPDVAEGQTLFQNFVAAKSTSNMGKFYELKQSLNAVLKGSISVQALLTSLQADLAMYDEQIKTADSILYHSSTSPNLTIAAALSNDIKLANMGVTNTLQQMQTVFQDYKNEVSGQIPALRQQLTGIIPDNLYEQNLWQVYSYILKTTEGLPVEYEEEADIYSIATECTYTAGPAVLMARALIKDCNQRVNLDSIANTCYPSSLPTEVFVSEESAERSGNTVPKWITSNIVTGEIVLNLPVNTSSIVFLFDSYGRQVYCAKNVTGLFNIGVNNLPTGMYMLSAQTGSKKPEIVRILKANKD